jgi:hypothetical protein
VRGRMKLGKHLFSTGLNYRLSAFLHELGSEKSIFHGVANVLKLKNFTFVPRTKTLKNL